MPAEREFVRIIQDAVGGRGTRILESPGPGDVPNPFRFPFDSLFGTQRALIHVRRVTPQHGAGSDHNRPPGEWHAQMIFDDSGRRAGIRNHLRAEDGFRTVLFGYVTL